MFKKLVSNLPFHPASLGQVAFYVHRLRQETAVRRAGLVLIVLTMIIQVFSILAPARPSLATSASDIVYGATTRQDVLDAYVKNRDKLGRTDIKAIFNHYGIGEEQIRKSSFTRIEESSSKDYINTSRSTTRFPDTFIPIQGANDGGVYEFPLEYWRQSQYPDGYPAITGVSKYGFRFWVLLKGCGNIVFEKGAKKPDLEIIKTRTTTGKIIPGDEVTYKIEYRNKGFASANNVTIGDRLADEFQYVRSKSSLDASLTRNGQLLVWKLNSKNGALPPTTRWHTITITVKAKQIKTDSAKVCNQSSIDASNSAKIVSNNSLNARCVVIDKPKCPGTGLPIPPGGLKDCVITCPDGSNVPYDKACKIPQISCSSLEIIKDKSWDTKVFQTTIIAQPGGKLKQIDYYVNGKRVAQKPFNNSSLTQDFEYTFNKPGDFTVRADLIASTGTVQKTSECEIKTTIEKPESPTPRLSTDKQVTNLTQKIADANNTTAKAGDVLRYTIIVENTGDAPATLALNGEYGESIADILEYADLTDKGDANFNETTGFLSWGTVTIAPKNSVQKTFTVTIKNPIPATPISASNPLSYDYVLHNKYGRDVFVKLDKPASKVIEQTATTLPNTGPGSSMIITTLAAMMFGYFFYRSRLLSKELEIIHHEYSAGGM